MWDSKSSSNSAFFQTYVEFFQNKNVRDHISTFANFEAKKSQKTTQKLFIYVYKCGLEFHFVSMLVQYVLAKSIKGISIKFSTDNKYTPGGGNLNFAPYK